MPAATIAWKPAIPFGLLLYATRQRHTPSLPQYQEPAEEHVIQFSGHFEAIIFLKAHERLASRFAQVSIYRAMVITTLLQSALRQHNFYKS
jgi:hypothetical protein